MPNEWEYDESKPSANEPFGDECPNCKRPHLFARVNGKHLCDKCDWCPEDARALVDV